MALQVYNPQHPQASSGWVALTEAAPWPIGVRVLHIRDTALAISAGAATTATISLPSEAWAVTHSLSGTASGTVTGGSGMLKLVAKGVTYGTNLEPLPALSTDAGTESVPRTTADTNEFGQFVGPLDAFKIRLTGLTGTEAVSLNYSITVFLV